MRWPPDSCSPCASCRAVSPSDAAGSGDSADAASPTASAGDSALSCFGRRDRDRLRRDRERGADASCSEKLPDHVFRWPVRGLRLLQQHPAPRHQPQSAPQTSCVGWQCASGGQPAFWQILLRLFSGCIIMLSDVSFCSVMERSGKLLSVFAEISALSNSLYCMGVSVQSTILKKRITESSEYRIAAHFMVR